MPEDENIRLARLKVQAQYARLDQNRRKKLAGKYEEPPPPTPEEQLSTLHLQMACENAEHEQRINELKAKARAIGRL